MAWSAAISWIVLRPLIASMATLALNSGLWVRRLLIGGSPFQGRCPASEVNDGGCPEKPDHLRADARMRRGVRIPAWYLLLVAVLGILSRCQSLRDLERFAIRHHSVLTAALDHELKSD